MLKLPLNLKIIIKKIIKSKKFLFKYLRCDLYVTDVRILPYIDVIRIHRIHKIILDLVSLDYYPAIFSNKLFLLAELYDLKKIYFITIFSIFKTIISNKRVDIIKTFLKNGVLLYLTKSKY